MPRVKDDQRKRAERPKTRTGCKTCKSRFIVLRMEIADVLNTHANPSSAQSDESNAMRLNLPACGVLQLEEGEFNKDFLRFQDTYSNRCDGYEPIFVDWHQNFGPIVAVSGAPGSPKVRISMGKRLPKS